MPEHLIIDRAVVEEVFRRWYDQPIEEHKVCLDPDECVEYFWTIAVEVVERRYSELTKGIRSGSLHS
jgi:hypothetical protein